LRRPRVDSIDLILEMHRNLDLPLDPELPNLPFLSDHQVSQAWDYLTFLPSRNSPEWANYPEPPQSLHHLNNREWSVLDYLLEMELHNLSQAENVH
jgi:hypothetical protein